MIFTKVRACLPYTLQQSAEYTSRYKAETKLHIFNVLLQETAHFKKNKANLIYTRFIVTTVLT